MVSPSALDSAKSELDGITKEGGQVPLSPKRRWWMKYAVLFALCIAGMIGFRACYPAGGNAASATPIVLKTPVGTVPPGIGRPGLPTSQPVVRPQVTVTWVVGRKAGVTAEGVTYEVQTGDVFGDDVAVGRFDRLRGVNLSWRGLTWWVPVSPAGKASGGNGRTAGWGGAGVPHSDGGLKPLPLTPGTR